MRFCLLLVLVACSNKKDKPGPGPEAEPDPEDVVGILIQPESLILPLGDDVQLRATGLTADRTALDVTAAVQWTSSSARVAPVSNALDGEGQVQGKSVGTSEIVANLGPVASVPLRVTVTDADLEGLTVEPAEITVGVGQSVPVRAWGTFSDGQTAEATAQVRWLTADGGVARIDDHAVIGVSAGSTRIHANWDGLESDKVPVDVKVSARPNLVATGIDAVGGDGYVLAEVAVSNDGNAGAADFYVDLFLDPTGTPRAGDVGDDWVRVPYLAPSTSDIVYLELENVSNGSHTLVALVDSVGDVDEPNESDNTAQATVDVRQSSPMGPDLVVRAFDGLGDSADAFFEVEVRNDGGAPSAGFYVDLFADRSNKPSVGDSGDDYTWVAGLAAGASVTLEFLVSVDCTQLCDSWALVDSTDTVTETDERNNTAEFILLADTGL